MLLDPADQFIAAILSRCDIAGSTILEVGCGAGRITRDLARYARRVVASDPDGNVLARARAAIGTGKVEFIRCSGEDLDFPANSFDHAVYPLSLHHIAPARMVECLSRTGSFLKAGGTILVIEPGDKGAMNEAKERFGAGSGDEAEGKAAAIRAMSAVPGWKCSNTMTFTTLFQFTDEADFIGNMLPRFNDLPDRVQADVLAFLARHRNGGGIVLDSERRMNVLSRSSPVFS